MNTYRNSILSPLKQEKPLKLFTSRASNKFSALESSPLRNLTVLWYGPKSALYAVPHFIYRYFRYPSMVFCFCTFMSLFICLFLFGFVFVFLFSPTSLHPSTYYTNENVNFSFSFICSLIYYDEWTLSLRQNNMSSGVRVFRINFVLNRLQSRTGNFNISISI